MAITLLLCSLIFVHAQAAEKTFLQRQTDENTFKDGIIDFIKEIIEWLEDAIKTVVQKLREFWDYIFRKNKEDMEKDFINTRKTFLNFLSNYSQECIKEGQFQYAADEKQAKEQSLTCLVRAGKDVLEIIFDAGKLTLKLLSYADDILNGLSRCFTWEPWRTIPCILLWIKTVIIDVVAAIKEIWSFFVVAEALIEDIGQQLFHCKEERETTLYRLLQKNQQLVTKCDHK